MQGAAAGQRGGGNAAAAAAAANHHHRQHQESSSSPFGRGGAYFKGALVSKFAIGFTVISYVYVANKGNGAILQLDSQKMFGNNTKGGLMLYRYLSSKITFLSPGEAMVGTSLLFFLMRKYEREMGTRKFVLFWLIVHGLTVVQEMVFLQGLDARNLVLDAPHPTRLVYSGPYCLLAALFTLYHMYAPRIHPRFFSALGFHFSEKTFYYVWYAQMILSGGWNVLLPIGAGTIATIIYTRTPLQTLQVSESVVRFLQPILQHLAPTTPPTPTPTAAAGPGAAPRMMMPRPAAAAAALLPRQPPHGPRPPPPPEDEIPVPEPDAEAIEQLTNMGFPRQQVMDALRQSHNNVEHAANRLLGGH